MKKKFLSIPAILLLLLLFVLYGTTYAWQYEITEENVTELFNYFNSYWYNNMNINTLKTRVNNSLNTYQNQYDNCILFVYNLSNSRHNMFIYYFDNSNTTLDYYNSNTSWKITSTEIKRYEVTSNSYTTLTQVITNPSNDRGQYFMIRNDLGTITGPLQSPDIMTIIEPIFYLFNQTPSNTNVDVDIFEDIPAYNRSTTEDLYLGYLMKPKEKTITDFSMIRAYYTGEYWKYIEVTTNKQNNYIYYNKYYEDEEVEMYDVYFNRQYIQDNNIYIITWSDRTEEPAINLTATFYIMNNQTIIVNGEVIPPSGDNIQGTIGELQEDINNNNDFWKETYDKLFTIDSGDAEEIINNFLESSNLGEYGLESGEIAILNILNGEPSDFKISWNSVIIPNLKNNTPTQLVPAGNINFSKVSVTLGNESYTLSEERLNQFMIIIGWVQLIMGISVVILTIANVWETLMRALGVGVGLYEDNADEHSTIVNVGEDGTMRTTEVVRTPTKSRIWYIHKKY